MFNLSIGTPNVTGQVAKEFSRSSSSTCDPTFEREDLRRRELGRSTGMSGWSCWSRIEETNDASTGGDRQEVRGGGPAAVHQVPQRRDVRKAVRRFSVIDSVHVVNYFPKSSCHIRFNNGFIQLMQTHSDKTSLHSLSITGNGNRIFTRIFLKKMDCN